MTSSWRLQRRGLISWHYATQGKIRSCGKIIVQLGKCISDVFVSGARKPMYFRCYQAALWMVQSVCLSVRPSVCPSVCHTFLTMFPSAYHHECVRSYYQWQKWRLCKRSRSEVKGQCHRGQHQTWPFPDRNSSLKFTHDDEMMHRAWICVGEVPFRFSRSSVNFQGQTDKKNRQFWPKLGFSGL